MPLGAWSDTTSDRRVTTTGPRWSWPPRPRSSPTSRSSTRASSSATRARIADMLRIVLNALRTGVVTTRYPAEPSVPPDRFRGAPLLRPGSGLPPPAVCPTGALSEHFDAGHRHVALDLARCVFCGRCAEDPWAGAVTMGRDFELAARCRNDLRIEVVADDPAVPAAEPARDSDAEAARASSEILRVLGRSLHLRHLDAGSCNACDWELAALLNPVYDVRRLG